MKGCALEAVSALSHKKNKGGFERMKKNLKKVISAVLALTLAMSSFVAMTTSAATFADVADTANYAEAVNALAALGAIAGYEDGTFLPDNNITRAEVTTMVVAALNMTADAQSSGETTKFADVNEKAKWAAGYVNVGVANGWISGMSATEFAPSDNVTYAQVLSMLTRILGYGDYAVSKGGWPDGYLAAAASAGILSGVSAAANDAMTRAQVAKLIWNAVQAPMLEVTVFGVDASNSSMEKLDGDGREFKTILSDKFDAYVFPNVKVEAKLDNAEVKLTQLVKAPWNPEISGFGTNGTEINNVKVGKTDAENYLFSSAKVVASYVDDEWELIYFKPTARISTTSVDGSLVANVDANLLEISKSSVSSATTKYKLDDGATVLYVNGEEIATITDDNADDVMAVISAAVGDVVLYEKTDSTKVYDKIMVNVYGLAKVNQVTERTNSVNVRLSTITWPLADLEVLSIADMDSFTIDSDDVANGDVVVSVTKNGAAADLAALAKGDVIAVKFDVETGIESSKSIEILATTDTVTGAYTYYDDADELYEVGGAMYEAARNLGIDRGNIYTFALDPFGRLFSAEEEATSVNYAILEKYTSKDYGSSSSEYDYLDVVTLDGQSKRLYVDDTTTAEDYAKGVADDINGSDVGERKDFSGDAIETRIIEYKVKTSTGRVNYVVVAEDVTKVEGKYNATSNRLTKPLASTAVVLDAVDYLASERPAASDYKASALSTISESVDYDAILVHRNSSNQYSYVILTAAGAKYGATSDFVVAAETSDEENGALVDDEDVFTLRVMKDGADKPEKLNISRSARVWKYDGESYDDVAYADGVIAKGSAFLYTTDSYGFVDRIDVILEGGDDFAAYNPADAVIYTPDNGEENDIINPNDWHVDVDEDGLSADNELIQIFVAPVLLASDRSVSFSTIVDDQYIDTNDEYSFGVTDETNIYYYDVADDALVGYNAFSDGSFTGIEVADADEDGKAWIIEHGDDHNFGTQYQLAFVMAVDGVVTNALIIGQ